jgi:hypothetical protein
VKALKTRLEEAGEYHDSASTEWSESATLGDVCRAIHELASTLALVGLAALVRK